MARAVTPGGGALEQLRGGTPAERCHRHPLRRHGVKDEQIAIVRAPVRSRFRWCAKVAAKGDVDAIIALGAVIRGGTPHFEYVAGECTKGIAQVSMETGVPIAFGVLTVDSIEQAVERSGTKAGNKGAEAALSALEWSACWPGSEPAAGMSRMNELAE